MDFVAKIASSLDGACPRDLLHGLVPSCVSTLRQRLSRNSPYSLEEFRNLEDHGRLQALCCHFTRKNVLSFGKNEEIYGRIYRLKWVGHNAYSRGKTIEWAVELLRFYHFTSILHGLIRTHK